MKASQRFDTYLDYLSDGLGHSDRDAGLRGYCTGLMLPLSRKSVEPMAAGLDPLHVRARHQSLHHFVAKADWSDAELLSRVRDWVMPKLGLETGGFWTIKAARRSADAARCAASAYESRRSAFTGR